MNEFEELFNSDVLTAIIFFVFIGIPLASITYSQIRNAKKVRSAFEQAAVALGLNYNSKSNTYNVFRLSGNNRHTTISGELFGTYRRKTVKIYIFNEHHGKKRIPSTYFEVNLNKFHIDFLLVKKGLGTKLIIKLFNPKFIDFNENYYIVSKSPFGPDDISKYLVEIKKLLSDSIVLQFEALPGSNALSVSDSKLIIIHQGIVTLFDELQQFLGFLTSIEKESSF